MNTFIALLRGINVGGRNKLPMRELVQVLERLGWQNIATYIQSGNVVFDEPGSGQPITATMVSSALEKEANISADVQLLSLEEMETAAAECPFASEKGNTLHLFFLSAAPTAPDLSAIEQASKASEQWRLTDAVFYLHAPDGIGRSKLAAKLSFADRLQGSAFGP